jgi:hypothetical protein
MLTVATSVHSFDSFFQLGKSFSVHIEDLIVKKKKKNQNYIHLHNIHLDRKFHKVHRAYTQTHILGRKITFPSAPSGILFVP